MIASGGGFVGFALFENPIRNRLQHGTNRTEALVRPSLAAVCQRYSAQGCYERIGSVHVICLVFSKASLAWV